jgi:hypothetical protein
LAAKGNLADGICQIISDKEIPDGVWEKQIVEKMCIVKWCGKAVVMIIDKCIMINEVGK